MREGNGLRVVALCALLLAASTALRGATAIAPVPLPMPLRTLPMKIGTWEGRAAPAFDRRVLEILAVDEYVNRSYRQPGEAPVGLYVGYYEQQQRGAAIHTPANCLPGSGWFPTEAGEQAIPLAGGPAIVVNRYVVQKEDARQVVLYWYHSHGRVVADEYRARILMVLDALLLRRTDGALVRVISPVGSDEQSTAAATDRAVLFVTAVYPWLARLLPA